MPDGRAGHIWISPRNSVTDGALRRRQARGNTMHFQKLLRLKGLLRTFGGCAIAYSGGVDSTFLVAVARGVLGDRALPVIAVSSTYPKREFESAVHWLNEESIPFVKVESEELDIPGFAENPTNRCYHCKMELYSRIWCVAQQHGLDVVVDGANADDTGDFRPGMQAARELNVRSPLLECGMTKADIRKLSGDVYHLPTADKQSMACLSSRFPYGSRITREKLAQVEKIEDFLADSGFRTFRARHHGDVLRLELGKSEAGLLQSDELRDALVTLAKESGFTYVTLDLEGFRSGSMNEVLPGGGK